jgi:5-methylcytosine-specific restriction endonuclease McrA
MTLDEILEMLKPWGWSEQAVDLGIRTDFRCEYCTRDLIASVDDYDAWQVDHILPRVDEREAPWNLARHAIS